MARAGLLPAGTEAQRRILWVPEAPRTGHTNMGDWGCWGKEGCGGGQVQGAKHAAFHVIPSLAKAQEEVAPLKYF